MLGVSRLLAVAAMAMNCGCSPQLRGNPSPETETAAVRVGDPQNLVQAFEARGYRSTHLGSGDYFSIKEESLRAAFDRGCERARVRWNPCDEFEQYGFHVVIDEHVARVEFLHEDRTASDFIAGFACGLSEEGWECALD